MFVYKHACWLCEEHCIYFICAIYRLNLTSLSRYVNSDSTCKSVVLSHGNLILSIHKYNLIQAALIFYSMFSRPHVNQMLEIWYCLSPFNGNQQFLLYIVLDAVCIIVVIVSITIKMYTYCYFNFNLCEVNVGARDEGTMWGKSDTLGSAWERTSTARIQPARGMLWTEFNVLFSPSVFITILYMKDEFCIPSC